MSTTPLSTTKTTLRLARYSELYTCAQILAVSFRDDVLFGRLMHPYRDRYPEDMALYFYRMFQSEFWDWSMVFLVSVVMDERRGEEVITGFAQWHRVGDTARRDGWGLAPWDPRNILRPISQIYSSIASMLIPNRAVSPQHATILADADPFTAHLWNGSSSRRERWYLHFLGVDPAHQNRGVGRRLVRWGIDQADREGVGAAVVAAHLKDRFYRNCGFRLVIGWSGQGVGNPLAVVEGGNIWWIGPRGGGGEGAEKKEVKAEEIEMETGMEGTWDRDGGRTFVVSSSSLSLPLSSPVALASVGGGEDDIGGDVDVDVGIGIGVDSSY